MGISSGPLPFATAPDSPGWADYVSGVVPFRGGSFLSQLLLCFTVAHFLGMLVRYYPSSWMGMLYAGVDDAAIPLLREAVAHVEEDFPKFVVDALTERRNF